MTTPSPAAERLASVLEAVSYLRAGHDVLSPHPSEIDDAMAAQDPPSPEWLARAEKVLAALGLVAVDPALVQAVREAEQRDAEHLARGGHTHDVRAHSADRAYEALGRAILAQLQND